MQKWLVASVLILAGVVAYGQTNQSFSERQSANFTRPCTPKPAGTEEVTSTAGASDTSSALTVGVVYYMKCDTAAYVDTSTTSSCTAASGDMKLPADTILPILTTANVRYLCARNVTSDGSCWITECQ